LIFGGKEKENVNASESCTPYLRRQPARKRETSPDEPRWVPEIGGGRFFRKCERSKKKEGASRGPGAVQRSPRRKKRSFPSLGHGGRGRFDFLDGRKKREKRKHIPIRKGWKKGATLACNPSISYCAQRKKGGGKRDICRK